MCISSVAPRVAVNSPSASSGPTMGDDQIRYMNSPINTNTKPHALVTSDLCFADADTRIANEEDENGASN